MAIPVYLAMTAEEFAESACLPDKIGWMACHFSHYGKGLSDLPGSLPVGSILILNDRVPIADHDTDLICDQLASWIGTQNLHGLLLDLQKPGDHKTGQLVQKLTERLPCKVAVSSCYAQNGHPIFLPPVPLHVPVSEYLVPWAGFEIWLDTTLNGCQLTVDPSGCHISDTAESGPFPHMDAALHCHYRIRCEKEQICFSLARTKESMADLLAEAENSGVTTAVGLYQELGHL